MHYRIVDATKCLGSVDICVYWWSFRSFRNNRSRWNACRGDWRSRCNTHVRDAHYSTDNTDEWSRHCHVQVCYAPWPAYTGQSSSETSWFPVCQDASTVYTCLIQFSSLSWSWSLSNRKTLEAVMMTIVSLVHSASPLSSCQTESNLRLLPPAGKNKNCCCNKKINYFLQCRRCNDNGLLGRNRSMTSIIRGTRSQTIATAWKPSDEWMPNRHIIIMTIWKTNTKEAKTVPGLLSRNMDTQLISFDHSNRSRIPCEGLVFFVNRQYIHFTPTNQVTWCQWNITRCRS